MLARVRSSDQRVLLRPQQRYGLQTHRRLYRKRPSAIDPGHARAETGIPAGRGPNKTHPEINPIQRRTGHGSRLSSGRGRQDRIRAGVDRGSETATSTRRPRRRELPEGLYRPASGTKAERPQWKLCLADLRPGDTLIIWRIGRLGRNLRDRIDIVTSLQTRGVGVRSLSNGIVDTTTAHGALVFGMFALMSEYEAALIRERTQAGLAAARARGRTGERKPKMTPSADQQGPADV